MNITSENYYKVFKNRLQVHVTTSLDINNFHIFSYTTSERYNSTNIG